MTDTSSVRRRYLALWFPFLSTDRLQIEEGEVGRLPDAPLVLVAKVKGAL